MGPQERQERRLAAILAADVVGSSRLIEADEKSVLATIHAVLSEVLRATAERHGGRLVTERAWVILNFAGAFVGYPALSMNADLSTAPKPSQ